MNSDEFQNKKDDLIRRMDKRWDEIAQQRSVPLDQRQETAEKYRCLTNRLLDWTSSIQQQIKEVSERRLNPDLDFMEITNVLDALAKDMQKFGVFFNENSETLSKYDVRQTQIAVNYMRNDYLELQDRLQHRKKFGFKSKTKTTKKADTQEDTRHPSPSVERLSVAAAGEDRGYSITNTKGESFIDVPESDVCDRDVSLDNLRDCVVKIFGTPSTVHGTNLTNVIVFCGPVKTSVFLENCDGCTFLLACQQLRTHATSNSKFYLHVTCKGIIEDCKAVGFAPYNLTYPSLRKHFAESGLDETKNAWDKISDFNWLSMDKPSPNWYLLPECERQSDWSPYLRS